MITRIVITIFLIALLMSGCCNEKTYEVTITGLESRAWIFDGISLTEFDIQNSINKEVLVIELDIIDVETIVSNELENNKNSKTKVLKAAVVPCEDQVVVFKNNIISIKVEILDVNNANERIDVTNQLVIQGSQTTIPQFIAENPQGISDLFVQFSDTSNLPDRMDYEIEATLDDGSTINTMNGTINFN